MTEEKLWSRYFAAAIAEFIGTGAAASEIAAKHADTALAEHRKRWPSLLPVDNATLDEAAKVAAGFDYSLQSSTPADARAQEIAAAIRDLAKGEKL